MQIIAITQCYENYGTAERHYWKAKGGAEYLIARVTVQEVVSLGRTGMSALVDKAREAGLDHRDDYSEEYVVDWDVVEDDYLTQFQRDELRFDRKLSGMGSLTDFWKMKEAA